MNSAKEKYYFWKKISCNFCVRSCNLWLLNLSAFFFSKLWRFCDLYQSNLRYAILRYEIYGTKFTVRNLRYEIYGTKFRVRNLRYEIYGTKFNVRNLRCQIYGTKLYQICVFYRPNLWFYIFRVRCLRYEFF